ncbi:hypothetical protein [Methylobacterium oryzisoli]|uniref:hypothetical protein n=1 Tax=Methylobacterium oryzisoli TaxID=3385502 RepID=UPI00389226AA
MPITSSGGPPDDPVFGALVGLLQAHHDRVRTEHGPHLFATQAPTDLFEVFLAHLPPETRPYHTCACCRRFVRRFGALVAIDPKGRQVPAVWNADRVPGLYLKAVAALARAVREAPVTSVFLSEAPVWGTPQAGGFTHFALRPATLHRSTSLTASQAMARTREAHRTLSHGLAEFGPGTVRAALNLLKADALFRGEKVLGPARFLHELHAARAGRPDAAADNLVWRAVAGAPVGFCTPRSTVIGPLLEDIRDGVAIEAIKRRFAAKLDPTLYARPQAAPKAGAIAAAERLAAQMNLGPALRRRFARIEECELVWRPAAGAEATAAESAGGRGGLFGHLASRRKARQPDEAAADPSVQTITWEKFARTVLPEALGIEVLTQPVMNLCALVTAEEPDAIPILQWDRPERRNPVNWYVYPKGSAPTRWRLPGDTWIAVTGITLQPSLWHGADLPHQGRSAILLMKGAVDDQDGGIALFPEVLRADLHGVRAVIEAYSRGAVLAGREEASACGLRVADGHETHGHRIRVRTDLGSTIYRVDRWD